MDLESVTDNGSEVVVVDDIVDIDDVMADTEQIVELTKDTETAFDSVFGLTDMIEQYEIITENADRESITEKQLTALRVGIVSGMQSANADSKRLLGVDLESAIVVPSSSLAYDMEGLKEFAKKAWEKFKELLIKANSFFKKLFLKFLNMLSFRKGTIEKLEEEVGSTTINEKFSGSLAAKATFINLINGKDNTEADLSGYKKVLNYESQKDSSDALNKGVKALRDRVKNIKDYVGGNATMTVAGAKYFDGVTKGVEKISKFENIGLVSKKSGAETLIVGGLFGTKGKGIGIKKNGDAIKINLTASTKTKTIKGVTSANLLALLKDAGSINEDFKSIVDATFEVVDDVMDISEDMGDIVMGEAVKLTDEKKKQFSKDKKSVQNMISLLPWMSFHSVLSLYKEIGFVIALSKEAVKEKK